MSIRYPKHCFTSEDQVLEEAADIIATRFVRGDAFCNPDHTMQFLSCKLGGFEREVFAVILLDSQHRLIKFDSLFFGTIDSATVNAREVVKSALNSNAAAVILAHNHPSGNAEPSNADIRLTRTICDALALIEVRVLDHIVVGKSCVSFAQRGLI